jgi:hypothetical protein
VKPLPEEDHRENGMTHTFVTPALDRMTGGKFRYYGYAVMCSR